VWRKSPHIQLEPWARINGRVRWGQRAGAAEKVDLSISLGDSWGWPDIISQRDSTVANADGAFVFERLLPGVTAQLSAPVDVNDDKGAGASVYVGERITHVTTRSPHGSALLGGRGRAVTGKLNGPGPWDGVTLSVSPADWEFSHGDGGTAKAREAIRTGRDGPLFYREQGKVAADGSFRVEGMLPGSYQINFTGTAGGDDYKASVNVAIPAETLDSDPEPVEVDPKRIIRF